MAVRDEPFENVTIANRVFDANAPLPIVATVDGTSTFIRSDWLAKALAAISVTPSGITAKPEQLVALVTTPLEIVKLPPKEHDWVPVVDACAGAAIKPRFRALPTNTERILLFMLLWYNV
jgi:hypothetical protein